ncbi:MAG TPA: response regulator transcription factor [Jatrophihabitantaceae bacterium]
MRILVVEDDSLLAAGLASILARAGHTIFPARTGADAEAFFAREALDLVILDIGLPDIDGFELLRRMRSGRGAVCVLVLTARDAVEDRVQGLDLGADDYLTKPFSFVVLLARLRALLRRGVTPRPAALTVGDLVLDPAAHTVIRSGRTIELTPREFALLEFLMRRAGEAVSKADILHHVWDAHYEGDANVVEVYVGYLRRKIDTPFGRQSVQTVRGAGYRLAAEGAMPSPAVGGAAPTVSPGASTSSG